MGRSPLTSLPGRLGSGPYWIKSSFSLSNGNCVEVASLPDSGIGGRDSRGSEGLVLRFTQDEWSAFVGGVKNGEFDDFCVKSPREQAVSCSPVLSQAQSPAQLIRKLETHIQLFTAWTKKWL